MGRCLCWVCMGEWVCLGCARGCEGVRGEGGWGGGRIRRTGQGQERCQAGVKVLRGLRRGSCLPQRWKPPGSPRHRRRTLMTATPPASLAMRSLSFSVSYTAGRRDRAPEKGGNQTGIRHGKWAIQALFH